MTLNTLLSKRMTSQQASSVQTVDEITYTTIKSDYENKIFSRLNKPLRQFLFRKANNQRSKTAQHNTSVMYPPSIIKPSNVTRTISKKTVTFASVFDMTEIENNYDDMNFSSETNGNDDVKLERDLITIIEQNVIDTQLDENKDAEKYPFRSDIPLSLSSKSDSLMDVDGLSNHSIESVDYINTINRSISVPNVKILTVSSEQYLDEKIAEEIRPQKSSRKTIRTWFKALLSIRFTQTFSKRSNQNNKNIIMETNTTNNQLIELSELIY